MSLERKSVNPERQQTNESLRLERQMVDGTLEEDQASIDDTADAVIYRARARADRVLAKARATTDGQRPPGARASVIVETNRVLEDQALRAERATADETLRGERAGQVSLISVERLETDRDLFSERARSDHALATRDEFLGVVSHDLRNILNTIVGFAGLIAKGVACEQHEASVLMNARRIERSGARMMRLIGDLVDVASIEAGRLAVTLEVGDAREVVTEAVEIFGPTALAGAVSLTAEVVPPSPLVSLDPARILQVLVNLLSNALKFTPTSGKVIVRVEQKEDELHFAVSDTGVGIAPDRVEALFQRFVQVAPGDRRGVGLGLYISKGIVQGHGGRIWAESKLGEGSTFYFALPIHAAR